MKFNERELITYSLEPPATRQGRLVYQRPQAKDWSEWVLNSTSPPFKDRWFKLKSNLLFYYRINEGGEIDFEQPLGVFVLETAHIQYENSRKMPPFAFSITFRDEPDKKHIFAAHSDEDVNEWVAALKMASYEYWRTQLAIIEKKLSMRIGDENVRKSKFTMAKQLDWRKETPGFKCHLYEEAPSNTTPAYSNATSGDQQNCQQHTVNLIDL